MVNGLVNEMSALSEKGDYGGILELGKGISPEELLEIPPYNGAAHIVYSWGYESGLNNRFGRPLETRELFRKCVDPGYVRRRHDMDMYKIEVYDEMDAHELYGNGTGNHKVSWHDMQNLCLRGQRARN